MMMALLGKYYAAKIRGATELALFRATRDAAHQALAVKHLEQRRCIWTAYAARVTAAYWPALLDQSRRHRRLAGARRPRCGMTSRLRAHLSSIPADFFAGRRWHMRKTPLEGHESRFFTEQAERT